VLIFDQDNCTDRALSSRTEVDSVVDL